MPEHTSKSGERESALKTSE